MPRVTRWSQLLVGVVAFVVIAAAVAAIMLFGQIGALHGATTRFVMVTDRAGGVIKGTEVWLAGQKVGVVDDVRLRPPSSDTLERVAISLEVLSEYTRYIRRNSDIQIRTGGSLLGSPVVFITVGSSASPQVDPGDTLRAQAQSETRPEVAAVGSLGDSVMAIASTASQISADLQTTTNRYRDVRERIVGQSGEVERALGNYSNRTLHSNGSVARLMADTARLRAEVAGLRATTDSIRTAATDGRGDVARFRNDPALVRRAQTVLARVDTLRSKMTRYAALGGSGDSALARQLALTHVQLDSLVQDAKHHPLRYLPF